MRVDRRLVAELQAALSELWRDREELRRSVKRFGVCHPERAQRVEGSAPIRDLGDSSLRNGFLAEARSGTPEWPRPPRPAEARSAARGSLRRTFKALGSWMERCGALVHGARPGEQCSASPRASAPPREPHA